MCPGKSVWKRITPYAVDGGWNAWNFFSFLASFAFSAWDPNLRLSRETGRVGGCDIFASLLQRNTGENGSLSKLWLMEGLDLKVYNDVSTHSNVCLSIWYLRLRICKSLINPEVSPGTAQVRVERSPSLPVWDTCLQEQHAAILQLYLSHYNMLSFIR